MGLIVSRKVGESVRIGPDVVVHVLDIQRGKARLVIDAPAGVRILRTELVEREQEGGSDE